MRLFFASHNLDKKKEIGYILSSFNFEVLYIDDFPEYPDVEETGSALAENAVLKAEAGFLFTKLDTFAEDTGLEVALLNNAPGVYTSRYAGKEATYEDNCNLLIENMRGLKGSDRRALFRTVLAFKTSDKVHLFEGECRGRIAEAKSGSNGFGYDPVFIPEGYEKTFAELDGEIKHKISHRALAVEKFCSFLKDYSGA